MGECKAERDIGEGDLVRAADLLDSPDSFDYRRRRRAIVVAGIRGRSGGENAGIVDSAKDHPDAFAEGNREKGLRAALLEQGVAAGHQNRVKVPSLGEACAEVMAAQGEPEPRVAKTRGKFARTPVVLVVGSEAGDSDLRTAENRDAVSAAVQTLLLGATALGMASFWSSCPKGANDAVAKFCGFPAESTVVAMVYLGWPTDVPQGFERPAPRINRFD